MCVTFRKLCNFSFFLIQQYNRSQETNFNHGGFQEPVLSDLKESGRTAAERQYFMCIFVNEKNHNRPRNVFNSLQQWIKQHTII